MTDRLKIKRERRILGLLERAEAALFPEGELDALSAHLDKRAARSELDVALDEARSHHDDVGRFVDRLERLDLAAASPSSDPKRRAYLERFGVAGVRRFRAGGSTHIFVMPVETFPRHVNNVYLVVEPSADHAGARMLLFDVGSGMPSARRDFALGFAVLRAMWDLPDARWDRLDTIVVSHAHIDHFGGLNVAQKETSARIAVHELDARVLACFDERVIVASKDVDVFLRRAGVSVEERAELASMYSSSKSFFKNVEPDRMLRDGDLVSAGYRVHHVPGHCPGLICLQVHDVLLTSDHVLARITPHQFPQAITAFGGLENYFHSLAKIRKLEGIDLALGGHEEPIDDLRTRIDQIALFHRERLRKVLELCAAPKTVLEVTSGMFGKQEGYGTLLALEEAGAHVEYLYQLGRLRIDNLQEVASAVDPVIRYVARG